MNILIFGLLWSAFAIEPQCIDANGNDIFHEPEIFQTMVQEANTCYEAARLAENCAYGSSLDVSTAGYATDVCKKELDANPKMKNSKRLARLYNIMVTECDIQYRGLEGTMYRSAQSFCVLKATEWLNNLLSAE